MSTNSNLAAKTFEQECKARWKYNCAARRISPETVRRDMKWIDDLRCHARKQLWEIGPSDLRSWCDHLEVERKIAPATIHSGQLAVCRVFSFFFMDRTIQSRAVTLFGSSFRSLVPVPMASNRPPETSTNLMSLSRVEVEHFFLYLADRIRNAQEDAPREVNLLRRDRAMYFVMYAYSLRASDCIALNTDSWRNDPDAPELEQWGKLVLPMGSDCFGALVSTHLGTTHASIPELVSWYLRDVRPLFNALADERGSPLFTNTNGRRIPVRSLHARLKAHLRSAGLATAHRARHSLRRTGVGRELDRSSINFIHEKLGYRHFTGLTHYSRPLPWAAHFGRVALTGQSNQDGDQERFKELVGPELRTTPLLGP